MVDKLYNVLFLCTGNSARSIMAECAISRWGQGRFRGFSAGSRPKGEVHPMALRLLERLNYRTDALRSKSWDEFADGKGPPLDFVFTVCDQAAGEVCPAWPGQPMTAHWGVEDPAAFVGTDEQNYKLFRNIYGQLENRMYGRLPPCKQVSSSLMYGRLPPCKQVSSSLRHAWSAAAMYPAC